MRRRCITLLAALAPLWVSSSTLAADRVSECVAAHAEGQELRNQGRLLAAKAKFSECKSESCPALVREECVAFAQSVDQSLPTVVFAALDEQGKFTADPTLSVDGAPLLVPFDGRAVALDPGPHRIVFQRPGGRARTVDLVLAESERDRRVVADFRPPPDQASVGSEPSGARTAVLVSAGVAALALGSFTYFALSGHAIQSDLERCKPNCENRSDLDRMRARYLGADLSLGAALVSLGVGAIIWAKNPAIFSHGGARPEPTLAFGVQPSSGTRGVELSARARF